MKAIINEFDGPVARVVDCRWWGYGEPDIIPVMDELYNWMQNNGTTRQIDLINSNLVKQLHLNQIENKSTIQFSNSDSPASVLTILKDEGWSLDEAFVPPDSIK